MNTKAKLVSLRAPVTINLAEGEDTGPPTFEAVAYSGGTLPGYTVTPPLDADYVMDLSGMTPGRSPKANLEHDQRKRVGHLTDIDIANQVHVKGVMSAATAHAQEVSASAKNGFTWEVSMEASLSNIKKLADGKTATVNGQKVEGPLYIVRKSTFTGLGFVDAGADEGNQVTIAAAAAGAKEMNEFDKWLLDNDFDPETITDKQRVKMQAAFDAEKSGPATITKPPTRLSAIVEAERRENDRVEAITRMSHQAMKDNPMWIDQISEMAERAIAEKTDAERFELELLRGTKHHSGRFSVASRKEPDSIVLEAALCRAAGLPGYEKQFKEEVLDAVDRNGLRHFSLQQMLMRAAISNGYDAAPGERITTSNIKKVLKRALPDDVDDVRSMRATAFSTVSLPGIFSNVANREILAGFTEEDQTWREISRIATSNDFRPNTAYRLTDDLEYELLPKGGEIKHGSVDEESYTRQIKTYAKMLSLTREDIINDDLGAFDDLRTRLGRGAARKFNNVFWTEFMNNASFFTTARGNYIEGATTALDNAGVGLGEAVAAFNAMESADGKRIGGTARILMVPPELQFVADQLFSGGDAAQQTVANTNVFRNRYRPVVVPWLSDASFTGNSALAWYLFRDPGVLAPMVVSFLGGNQTPTVESTDVDFANLGIQFRGFWDFGSDQAEYLAGLKVKGEA